MMNSHRVKLIAAFATLYVVWGSTYLAIRIGLSDQMPPALFAGLRLVPAGLALLAFAAARGRSVRMRPSDLRTTAIVGIFLLVGGMYSTFLSERVIPSGLAALIVALLPLWIALAEWALPDMERPSAQGVAGLLLGLAGLAVLVAPRITGVHGTPEELGGIAIQIAGTWLWTAGSVYSKRRPVKADALVVTGYEMLVAGTVLLGIGTVAGEWGRLSLTPRSIGALAYLTVVGSCIAFTAFVWLLRNAPASKVMTYAYVNPAIAVALGHLAGHAGLVPPEPVDAWTLLGAGVIIAGVALATSAPTRPPRRPPATAD
ncbi:permeases of the drug/metabolite transporter (DMT) superfamily [Coriobacteriaceae bacterium EMTCatB1]|nr:permeases of the drug/metabolite transporter (DMT) superfamily [Coriobacteriaceae bacterium EMTCatB1]